MKKLVSIWTTSQYPYDQRIQRIVHLMESMGAQVTVWDRMTTDNPEGKIKPRQTGGPGFYMDYNFKIARFAGRQKSDLHYSADIDVMPGLMWALQGNRQTQVLLDLHEWFPEVIELGNKPIKKEIWRWVERRSIDFATARMTVNHSLQHIFEKKYDQNFTVIRNMPVMTSPQRVDDNIRLENKILYYQGALNAGRGLEIAVESLHFLPGWKLWLVGDGDISDRLKALVKHHRLEDRVHFFGRKSPEELISLAAGATVGLNLLDGQSQSYYYSLANRYFDYIHAWLPSIHMEYPEYRNMMKEYSVGHLIPELTLTILVKAVRQITDHNNQYYNMIDQCKSAAKMYNWAEESKVLVELLESL